MNKIEIYYKFILPKYSKLSINDDNTAFIPDSDGDSQLGEVRALCNTCPSRVITYDQLDIKNKLDGPTEWSDSTIWPSDKKNEIKHYVDDYLSIPKYFDLRNYWDDQPCQQGGMSLMVSHSPEIGFTSTDWTKFSSTYNGVTKYVYCSLMISSGDFFYSFNLPEEAILKSGLRDEIVANKFHNNWFITNNDIYIRRAVPRAIHFNNSDYIYYRDDPSSHAYIPDSNYPGYPYSDLFSLNSPSPENPLSGHEKRVFDQHYFSDHYQYGLQYSTVPATKYSDFKEDLKRDFIELEVTRRILYYYDGVNLKNPDNGNLIAITGTNDIPILVDKVDYPSDIPQGYLWWSSIPSHNDEIPNLNMETPIQINSYVDGEWKEVTVYTSESYAANNCQLLRDYSKRITKTLLEGRGRIGKYTKVSYEPPDIYRTDKGGCPPLQIPYNLLRYTLNDRPPFSDCETVLVMWVANGDPKDVEDGDIEALHNLDWQQYAIPISVRCCFKDVSNDGDKYSHDRFLVSYPHVIDSVTPSSEYKYHFRQNSSYVKDYFGEALYLQSLIEHSRDNIIACRNMAYDSNSFSIQRYLFLHCSEENKKDALKALYIRKQPKSVLYNQQTQIYYLFVPKELYEVNTDLPACISDPIDSSALKPAQLDYFRQEKFSKWDFDGDNDWQINNQWFITIFDKSKIGTKDSPLQEVSGKLELVDAENLRSSLPKIGSYTWDDIYLTSLCISPSSLVYDNSIINGANTLSGIGVSLDYLHNHIKIGDTVYGTNTGLNQKVVVGFKDVYDYKLDDSHHFHYNSDTNTYTLVTNSNFLYTAYVLDNS